MKDDLKHRLAALAKPMGQGGPTPALILGLMAVTIFAGLYIIYQGLIERSLLVIAFGAVLAAIPLVGFVGLASEVLKIRMGLRIPFLVGTPLLLTIILALYIYVGQGRPSEDILTAMATVCQGNGVPQAAAYVSGHSPHPIVLINESNETGTKANGWPSQLPHAWRPSQIDSTELVVCVGEKQEEIYQTCPYEDGRSVIRYQSTREVMLVEARTGKVITSETFRGNPAHACDKVVGFKPEEMAIGHYGTPVSLSQIVSWLKPYVESDR